MCGVLRETSTFYKRAPEKGSRLQAFQVELLFCGSPVGGLHSANMRMCFLWYVHLYVDVIVCFPSVYIAFSSLSPFCVFVSVILCTWNKTL